MVRDAGRWAASPRPRRRPARRARCPALSAFAGLLVLALAARWLVGPNRLAVRYPRRAEAVRGEPGPRGLLPNTRIGRRVGSRHTIGGGSGEVVGQSWWPAPVTRRRLQGRTVPTGKVDAANRREVPHGPKPADPQAPRPPRHVRREQAVPTGRWASGHEDSRP